MYTFGGNDKIRGITTNAMSQAWTISIDFSLIIGTDVEFVRRSLNMFAIVPNIQVVRSCFCRLVKYSNATVSIIFNMWKMHCIARCLHLSGNITSYVKEQKNNNGGKTRSVRIKNCKWVLFFIGIIIMLLTCRRKWDMV